METPSGTDLPFLREAIALARTGAAGGAGGPFGAVVVLDERIVGRGENRVTSTNDPTAHAEVVALRDACASLGRFHLAGATLFTSCEPCPMCLAAAYWAHIDRIVFACTRDDAAAIGFDDAFLYRELAAPPATRRVPEISLLRDEGLVAFRAWASNPRRVPY